MMRSLTGRADLLRVLACDGLSLHTGIAAELCGYQEEPETAPLLLPVSEQPEALAVSGSRTQAAYRPAPIPFWRPVSFEAVALVAAPPLQAAIPKKPTPTPVVSSPLAPERQVLTQLRQVAAPRREGREIDVEAVVERIGRGRLLDRLPYRQQRAWGERLCVVTHGARRLTPYWWDQRSLVVQLKRLYPSNGLMLVRVDGDDLPPLVLNAKQEKGVPLAPAPGTVVLVLGDLGCLAESREQVCALWRQWGHELRTQDVVPVALVPALPRDIPADLAGVWTIVPWGVATGAGGDSAATDELVQRLLTLCSPTVRLEPGLLRAVRCLLSEGRRDPGVEARVWQSPALSSRHSVAASWQPDQRRALLKRFTHEPEALRNAVVELIRAWRTPLRPGVWFSEIIDLDPSSRLAAIDADEYEEAVRYFTELAEAWDPSDPLPVDIGAWIERSTDRFTDAINADPRIQRAVHRLYKLVRPQDDETQVPGWYDPAVLSSPDLSVRQIELWHAGDQLIVQSAGQSPVTHGSRLGLLYTANGEVVVKPGEEKDEKGQPLDVSRQPRLAMALPGESGFRVYTDRDRLQFIRETKPEWASEIGRDQFGLWAAFEVAGVRQQLRWIPPGRFWMGSPENEEGRYDNEGPRHEVQLTHGFWLFDTPCTQALWQAVMKRNPSHFEGKERPVEHVSWEDCQKFIAKLNDQRPGLALALPTEAEWEYACRAGTNTARYGEDLDAIAWYHKNSNDQTHPVKQKKPNAWGLYDVLGNVAEWCHDGRRNYVTDAVVNPLGPTTAGARRVIRGGGWRWGALHIRSAYRYANRSGYYRSDDLGFRCTSSGQVSRSGER